ncbi:MAG: 2,3-bisphosphoglycerate-independent phosphoglycerate mutase [bacterium]
MHKSRKVILLIMDGWGLGKPDKFNAIDNAKKPNYDKLVRDFHNTRLFSHGAYVGLPDDQFGTSEINHQVIGSGRVIMQDLPRIDNAIKSGEFFTNKVMVDLCQRVRDNGKALHIVGIISDGKVHSSLEHLEALIKLAQNEGVKKLNIHAFSDGRDTPPKSVTKYLEAVEKMLAGYPEAQLVTLQGRSFLDRDRDWDKTAQAVDLLVEGKGMKLANFQAAINLSYNQNITDEYFQQFIFSGNGKIQAGDSVFFTHYRSDRLYQVVKALKDRAIKNISIGTFIEISEDIKTEMAYPRPVVTHSLAETISLAGMKQYHVTETEKYTHLTYFFNCGQEKAFPGEEWKLYSSEKFVKPYYQYLPTMQNYVVTQDILMQIEKNKYNFIVANFCSADMVGHTGDYSAAVVSAQSVDFCLGKIFEKIKDRLDEYVVMITADHGNSDMMWDYGNEQPHTQHTANPVPFIFISDLNVKLDQKEGLQDIAPTILDVMNLEIPKVMVGKSLLLKP